MNRSEIDEEFWNAAREGRLRLPRCPCCHAWWWYPLDTGPCHAAAYEWVEIPTTSLVFTRTDVQRAFVPGQAVPFTLALVIPGAAPVVRLVVRLGGEAAIGDSVDLKGVAETENGPVLVFGARSDQSSRPTST
ncbi:Zn-ribbon domain-containing OB-fold protein [Nocardioides terrisoli]|uniref:Zn-ribbon domain-containing OB-fold protein n=1 Tax=Nocardioides terrisoli TaxID=3388267 RepID=UPI00287BC95F|nr:hypothetical protein [Nocardioides marmorisolisilvae]